jgi:protein-disulfide isomerase
MKNKLFISSLVIVFLFLMAFWGLSKNFMNQANNSEVNGSQTTSEAEGFRVVPVDLSLLIKPHSPVKGAFNSKVTIVEFLDPECEACGGMFPIVKKIIKEHESEVKLVVRYMTYHGNSKYVANILEGARAQNKYWEALEILFATQEQWANHHDPKPDMIPELLKPLNLDIKKIIADAKAGKYDKQITEDSADGKAVGVSGTPTFFVNGHMLQELGYDSLKSAVIESLNRQ